MKGKNNNTLLGGYRGLDLTDEKGGFCGKVLADLGADIIKVEMPGGDAARGIGPFYRDVPAPENSLFWFAFNTSKRGITLNIETVDGKALFKRLASTMDFIIESFPPGYLDRLGLGYEALSEADPRLIMVSISPFGQAGPYRDYKACDIVLAAMSGMMYPYGDADRSPVRISIDQTCLQGSVMAATGLLLALRARELTGKGQQVDTSIQEACAMTQFYDQSWWHVMGFNMPRQGPRRRRGNIVQRELWPCKDGHVAFRLVGGALAKSGVRPLAEWMKSEGKAGVLGEVEDWSQIDIAKMSQDESDVWERTLEDFFMTHTKAEIYAEALARGIFLLPGYDIKEISEDKQLSAREFWTRVLHPQLGDTITYPGAPYKFSNSPWSINRCAPSIGEHNEEVYGGEMGLSGQELLSLKRNKII